jgi:hypothetical protein
MGGLMLPEDRLLTTGAASARLVPWRHGRVLRVTVVAKATFAFANDTTVLLMSPQPIFAAEIAHAGVGVRPHFRPSPRFTSDLAPRLDQAEILFTGSAYAPGGGRAGAKGPSSTRPPAETSHVRIGLFDGQEAVFDKMIVVFKKGGFTRMPLIWENAFGGTTCTQNPVGVGADPESGDPILAEPGKEREPACFAPLASSWIPRLARLAGAPSPRLDGSLVELPEEFDFRYFQSAPEDQWVRGLRGDEWIVIDGVHPTLPRLRMRLPGPRVVARLHGLEPFGVDAGEEMVLLPDVLRIDGDEQRVTLTFRTAVAVPMEALDTIRVMVGVELPGHPIVWPSPDAFNALRPPLSQYFGGAPSTAPLGNDFRPARTHPFVRPDQLAASTRPGSARTRHAPTNATHAEPAPPSTATLALDPTDATHALPFAAPPGVAAAPYQVLAPPALVVTPAPISTPRFVHEPPAPPPPDPPPSPLPARAPIVTPAREPLWADQPPKRQAANAAPPAPKPAPKRVNVGSKLYGTSRKP